MVKKNDKKENKKTKKIFVKIKGWGVSLWSVILTFLFTGSVRGETFPGGQPVPLYAPSPPLDEIIASSAKFASNILFIPLIVFLAIFLIFRKRKPEKRWPKILVIIFLSLFVLSLLVYFLFSSSLVQL